MDQDSEAFRRLGYHPVASERQMHIYETNRELYMSIYQYINNLGEPTREREQAMKQLQDSLMWLNAHVACNAVGVDDVA